MDECTDDAERLPLLAHRAADEDAAFMELWDVVEPTLRRYVGRRVADRDTAEDLLQETVLAVWRRRSSLRRVKKPEAWFTRIVSNKIADAYRRAATRNEVVECAEQLIDRFRIEEPFRLDDVDLDDLADGLRAVQPSGLMVLFLRYVWDYDVKTLAEICHVPEGTMKYQLHAVRAYLKLHIRTRQAKRLDRTVGIATTNRPRIGPLEQPPGVVMPELTIFGGPTTSSGIRTRRVVYANDLDARIYYPAEHVEGDRRPAAVISICYPDSVARRVWGGPLRDAPWYVTWCTAIASTGLIAVAPCVETRENMIDLMGFIASAGAELGIDASRLALYACSGCASTALYTLRADLRRTAPAIRFLVFYYPVLVPDEEIPDLYENVADVPMLIAKAARERPDLATAVDAFIGDLKRKGRDLKVLEHTEGEHAFDVFNRDQQTRMIIEYTLEAMRHSLLFEPDRRP